jgi:hypothetical protein
LRRVCPRFVLPRRRERRRSHRRHCPIRSCDRRRSGHRGSAVRHHDHPLRFRRSDWARRHDDRRRRPHAVDTHPRSSRRFHTHDRTRRFLVRGKRWSRPWRRWRPSYTPWCIHHRGTALLSCTLYPRCRSRASWSRHPDSRSPRSCRTRCRSQARPPTPAVRSIWRALPLSFSIFRLGLQDPLPDVGDDPQLPGVGLLALLWMLSIVSLDALAEPSSTAA